MRAGLRRGELVALQWGDIQFGNDEDDPNRFIHVRHNYVRREHTTTKSKKTRRVDLSRELRRALLELRDQRLLRAYQEGKDDISAERVMQQGGQRRKGQERRSRKQLRTNLHQGRTKPKTPWSEKSPKLLI